MNKPENPFFNFLFNLIIPVVLLNKGSLLFGKNSGVLVLLIALAFPVLYGLFDLLKNKRKNIISIFGILNVLFTGGLALYKAQGIWFAVKEAIFPLLIGIFVFISAFTKKNFFEYLTHCSPVFHWNLIEEKIQTFSSVNYLKKLFKKATIMFSLSFFISAVLNFVLAMYIFSEVDAIAPSAEKEIILNQKIADMTWLGFIVIGLPMTAFAIGIFWWFLKKLSKATHLSIEQIMVTKK